MLRKMLSVLFILAGLTLIGYPWLRDQYVAYRQEQMMDLWRSNLALIEAGQPSGQEAETEPGTGDVFFPDEQDREIGEAALEEARQRQAAQEEARLQAIQEYMAQNMEGILTIEKIKLEVPILTNATEKNLNLAVASIEKTARAGTVGNYGIAGHRNYTYGKNFNRLDELDIGDIIQVDTGSELFIYEVYEKHYVLPDEVWVLNGDGKNRIISLVTCHPMKNPTHRLIIKGKIME